MLRIHAIRDRITTLQTDEDVSLAKNKVKKFRPVLKLVREYLARTKAVYYGGTAINAYLPPSARFYGPEDVPDYDVFVSNPEEVAQEVADLLYSNGYHFVTVRNAIHAGTFKISWEFEDVLDLSMVSKREERLLYETATPTKDGLRLANTELLKANAYIELSAPKGSIHRWEKVMDRVYRLEKAHPVSKGSYEITYSKIDHSIKKIAQRVWKRVTSEDYPIIGVQAMRYYTNEPFDLGVRYHARFRVLQVLAISVSDCVTSILAAVGKKSVRTRVYTTNATSTLVAPKTCVDVMPNGETKWTRLVSVHDCSKRCITVQRAPNGVMYGSLFYLVSALYMHNFLKTTSADIKELTKKNARMIDLLLKSISTSDFDTNCYGVSKSLLSVKKSRARKQMRLVVYNPESKA